MAEHGRGVAITTYLAACVAAGAVPLLCLVGYLLYMAAADERARLIRDAGTIAESVARDVDGELAALIRTLETLAEAPLLRAGDLERFHPLAYAAAARLGAQLVVADRQGQILLNTRVPWGTALPRSDSLAAVTRHEPGRTAPHVSGFLIGSVTGLPAIVIDVPVTRPGDTVPDRSLSLILRTAHLGGLIGNRALPRNGWVTLMDADGIILARTLDPALIGRPVLPPVHAALARGDASIELVSPEGIRNYGSFARIPTADWTAAVAVPVETLFAPMRGWLWRAGLLVVCSVLLGTWLAVGVGRPMARHVLRLAAMADALSKRMPLPAAGAATVREIDTVAEALATADRRLAAQQAERDAVWTMLRESTAVVRDRDGRIRFWSEGARRLYGYSAAEAAGALIHALLQTVFPEPLPAIEASLDAQGRWEGELRHRCRDGRVIRVHSIWTLRTDPATGLCAVLEDSTDLTALREAEAALEESVAVAERRLAELEVIYDSAPIGLCILDRNLRHIRINGRMAEMNGLPAAAHVGRTVREVVPALADAIEPRLRRVLSTGEAVLDVEIVGETAARPGEPRSWIVSWVPVRDERRAVAAISVVVEEVTERKRSEAALRELNETLESRVAEAVESTRAAQAQLAQAQKLEVVGQLTSGIAHDFNNMLAAIIGNIELLKLHGGGDPRLAPLLDNADQAAQRGARLVSQLLAFARKQHLERTRIDLNAAVIKLGELLRRTLGPAIHMELLLAPTMWPVLADPSQIDAALLNLCINARDAMPRGGALTISTATVPATHGAAPAPGLRPEQDYVMLAVSDTGTGMSDAVLHRVFEPFFTTKEIGKGSGLGLSMVLGTAQQHGGEVVIESRPGLGTTVRIYLPREDAPAADVAATAGAGTAALRTRRPARVLVVDDEEPVREVAVAALATAGHQVVAAASGGEALSLLRTERFDLALVDIGMPLMTGTELADAARAVAPDLRFLFMTGYGARDGLREPLLRKPFRMQRLVEAVDDLLAPPPRPGA